MDVGDGVLQAMRRVGASVRYVANGDSEDVVQEACVRAIKSGVSLEAEQWLRTVAKRVAIDQHRRRRETPSGAASDLESWAAPGDCDPEESYIRAERSQAVREAMATLPPRYRRALEAYAEEDSPAAVANRLGLSASATWTLLSRARSRLRLQLEQVGFVPAMIINHPKFKGILAAGAAAGVAATMAVMPSRPPADAAAPPAPKVAQVATGTAPPVVEDVVEAAAVKAPVVDTTRVTTKVDETVADVKTNVPAEVKVTTCALGDEVGLELSLVEDRPTLLTNVIESVPAPLRAPPILPCN